MTIARLDHAESDQVHGQGGIEHLDWSSPASSSSLGVSATSVAAREPFSPARSMLPVALLALVLSVVGVGYAVVLQSDVLLMAAGVLTASVAGAVAGLVVRDGRNRWVTKRRALGDGLRGLGRALWH